MVYIDKYNYRQIYIYIYTDYDNAPCTKEDTEKSKSLFPLWSFNIASKHFNKFSHKSIVIVLQRNNK